MQRIHVHLTPGSSRNACECMADIITGEPIYKVWLTAKPIKGEANQQLILFLSDYFDLPKRAFTLVQWHTSRHKIIEIAD